MSLIVERDPIEATRAVLELWNRALGTRFPLDAALWTQQLRMERGEKVLLAAYGDGTGTGGPLLGFALVKWAGRRAADGALPGHGNLSAFLVAPEARRRGLGSALLARAEAWLRERGAARLHLGRDSYHFFPGAPLDGDPGSEALLAFLAARGFALENEEHDVYAELGELDLEALGRTVKRAPGYATLPYEPRLRAATEAFFKANFPGRWYADTMEAIDAGMRPQDLLVLLEEASGAVVGFSRIYEASSTVLGPGVYWRGIMGSAPCGLGPIGVDESRRGLGLGLRLLYDSLVELRRRGGRGMMIDWTDLVDFYAKMGFRTWKSYRMASKELGGRDGAR